MKYIFYFSGFISISIAYQNCGALEGQEQVSHLTRSFQQDDEQISIEKRIVPQNSFQFFNRLASLFSLESEIVNLSKKPKPFEIQESTARFSSDRSLISISETDFEKAWNMAEFTAEKISKYEMNAKKTCFSQGDTSDLCLKSIVNDWYYRIISQPISEEDLTRYTRLLTADNLHKDEPLEALTRLTLGLLMSPLQLYRSELGNENGQLTSYEIAKLISYTLKDAPPDNILLESAKLGKLTDPNERKIQALRLLEDFENNWSLIRFFQDYFHYTTVDSDKDTTDFPSLDYKTLISDTDNLVSYVMQKNGQNNFWSTLISTDKIYVTKKTARNYKMDPASYTSEGEITDAIDGRSGILTQPSWLIHFSKDTENYAIGRGRFIRESLLCGEIPARDIDAIPSLPDDPEATLRERMAMTETSSCYQCHSYMNPLGYAFEGFDHFGRFRDHELGQPINATGWIDGTGDQDGDFKNHLDMTQRLAKSKTTQGCFIAHSLQYFMGINQRPGLSSEEVLPIILDYDKSGGNYKEMVANIFSLDSIILREAP